MPRLTPVRRERLIKVLRANGITGEKQSKKHNVVMFHPDDPSRWTTIPNYDEIAVGRLNDILDQVRKPRDEYMQVLRTV
jgi:predicted RNA binding protein YcfA (HicA-like mRNA interferase family)